MSKSWVKHLEQLCRQNTCFAEACAERIAIMLADDVPDAKWHAYVSTCRALGYVPEQAELPWEGQVRG